MARTESRQPNETRPRYDRAPRAAQPPRAPQPSRAPQPPRPPQGRRPWRRPRLPFRPIVGGFLLAASLATALAAWLLVDRLGWHALLAYLAAVNAATFALYVYDKSVARTDPTQGRRLWRVPEPVLHTLTLAGGTPAAFAAQRALRHKTLKQPFRAWFWGIVAVQFVAACYGIWHTGMLG